MLDGFAQKHETHHRNECSENVPSGLIAISRLTDFLTCIGKSLQRRAPLTIESHMPPEILTLHRYFIWANTMRTHFDQILAEILAAKKQLEGATEIESFLYMSYWYGGLYVVIEGWKALGLSDAVIDDLLASPNVELLRRYRNGVFHFQRVYDDERFHEFMTQGTDEVAWVRTLNEQFGRYFLERRDRRDFP
jgi:hypothetical protein